MLGDVSEPGALAQPVLEAADPARSAGVLADSGQHLEQRLHEAGDRVAREMLEHAEVDDQLDGRLVVPVVRPAVDAGLDDLQLGTRLRSCRRAGHGALDSRGATRRRGHSLASRSMRLARCARRPSPFRCRVVGSLGSDAPDQATRLVGGRLQAGKLAIGGAHRSQRRHQLSLPDVEPIARGKRVERDARDHDRSVALDLVGVGLDVRRVDDGDRALPEHLEDALRADERRRVLVDADAEQGRGLRHQRQQPPEAVALLEVLVDQHARQQPEPGAHLRHSLFRRRAARPERDHVTGDGRCAGAGARDHRAVPVTLDDALAEQRAADHAGEPQLVAAGHEDGGRVVHLRDETRIVRVVPDQWPHAPHVTDPHLAEERHVELRRLIAE